MTDTNNPISPDALAQEKHIWKLVNAKQLKQALASCQELNKQHPAFASGWHTASQLAMHANRPDVALRAIERAVELEPESIDWLLQKGLCHCHLRENAQLDVILNGLTKRKMERAYHCSTLAMLLTQLERREEAIQYYQKAAEMTPGQSQHFYNIGVLQRTMGQIEEAEKSFDKAISLNPSDFEAYKVRSELRTQTPDNNHVKAMEKLLKRGITDLRGKVNVCFGLSKELEDLGESEKSFHFLKVGAETRRGYMKYEPQEDLDTMTVIRETYDAEIFKKGIEGDDNPEPIFIIGMPRTGTTLVERILSSHTQVHSAGELTNFTAKMMEQAKVLVNSRNISKKELVALTTRLDFRKLGKEYVESTRQFTGTTAHFIDKLPLNYLYAGLIHLALPNAKIINLKRNPMDACYAIYKQLFVDGYPFSYELEELGNYYLAYHRLMEHWHEVMPGVIHTVEYEKLVDDVETESRALLEYCGLEWQEACLRFYENKQASATASSAQVRQPVYRTSVAKWKRYEKQLAPLISLLEGGGISLD